jgi:hypothetical protein
MWRCFVGDCVSKWHPVFTPILLFPFLFPAVGCAQSKAKETSFPELEKIAKTYQIEMVAIDAKFPVKTTHGKIDGQNADREEIQSYINLFVPEFSLYPKDLIKRTKLKRIVLCRKLSFAGQLRGGIPDYEHDTLYLDVKCGDYSKPYQRTAIHHEVFHLLDYQDDGNVYQDERWGSLNPADFKYGGGGKLAQDNPDSGVLTEKYPGFLNHYSTMGVEEDKAEVFANLIVDLAYVEKRIKKEAVLRAKVKRMKELLTEFCPEMNERFWEKVRKMKRVDE